MKKCCSLKLDRIISIEDCSEPFWLNRVGLPPAVLGPNILSMGVEISPTATQFDPACAQTMPRFPGVCLWRAELFQMSRGRQI